MYYTLNFDGILDQLLSNLFQCEEDMEIKVEVMLIT